MRGDCCEVREGVTSGDRDRCLGARLGRHGQARRIVHDVRVGDNSGVVEDKPGARSGAVAGSGNDLEDGTLGVVERGCGGRLVEAAVAGPREEAARNPQAMAAWLEVVAASAAFLALLATFILLLAKADAINKRTKADIEPMRR